MRSRQIALAISLLIHLLLLSGFIVSWKFFPDTEKPEPRPAYYVPSYTKSENALATPPSPAVPPQKMAEEKKVETDKMGIEKKRVAATPAPTTSPQTPSKPQEQQVSKASKDDDGVHLIGDQKIDKPLLKLLGKAISRTLIYPKIAIDFNLRGISYIGFTLQPNGMVSGVKVVKSSGEEVLDNAATRAIIGISPVVNVNQFLDKPKYLVVGIIFG
jgi:protein TonB